ncbi:Putative signal transducing protein [Flavobacteriaceae bacterium MAR_2010_188]|nr:Putative signal transducing protein [Flavobacteriaceae bacterium MAR_2010_188]
MNKYNIMEATDYIKVYAGNFVVVQSMMGRFEDAGINAIIKDESESGRLAGFGSSIQGFQEVFVHKDELKKATLIVDEIKQDMEAEN